MLVRRAAVAVCVVGAAVGILAAAGCASLLGDFDIGTADTSMDMTSDSASPDAPGVEGAVADATPRSDGSDAALVDSRADAPGSTADGGCGAGLTQCASGCFALDATTTCGSCTTNCTSLLADAHVASSSVGCTGGRCGYTCAAGYGDCSDSGTGCSVNLDDAAAHCGQCGHSCNGGGCAASSCRAYIVAQQPTTGAVAKLATDGTRVVWADTNIAAIEQIAAAGGSAVAIAPPSTTNGPVSGELALAGRTVAFTYLGGTAPSVGLATVDVADSGVSVFPGAVAVDGVSLNGSATHVFFINTTGTQSSLNDCAINGHDAGACIGIGTTGRFLPQTAADNGYLLFDQTSANTPGQDGLYIGTIGDTMPNQFSQAAAKSLALDGTFAYWTQQNDAGATYAILRTLESSANTGAPQVVAPSVASIAFATDGVNVYYWTGTMIASRPVAGGTETALAPASTFSQIAVGGGLLVWTDKTSGMSTGATIWGLVLP